MHGFVSVVSETAPRDAPKKSPIMRWTMNSVNLFSVTLLTLLSLG